MGAVLLIGCTQHAQSTGEGPSPIGACADGSSPDFQKDATNCGGCEIRCDDLRGAAMCQAGVCRLAEPVQCEPGYLDADGNPSNGCECRGSSKATCQTCLDYEIPMNGIDDDCEDATPDVGPGAGPTAMPISRAHCGGRNLSCTLEPGAENTRCALVACTRSRAAAGLCGHCPEAGEDGTRLCGQCLPVGSGQTFEAHDECFDGIDQDGNGRRDDGPYCEVLLANAITSDCNLAAPSEACPPNVIEIPNAGSPLPVLKVGLTYDLFMDRFEITRAQFARFLHETGQCALDADGLTPKHCTFPKEAARHPVTDVTWCAAYDYCAWDGDSRLPTVAEYYRAAGGDSQDGRGPEDAQGPLQRYVDQCEDDAVLPECGAYGVQRVDSWGGMGIIGAPFGADLALRTVYHLTGNVAEWLFDARVDWCETEGPHALPPLAEITCSDTGFAYQRHPLLDWAASRIPQSDGERAQPSRQQRMMGGAGWASAPGTAQYEQQQAAYPGVRSGGYGFRCVRTFHPDPLLCGGFPYDQTTSSREWTTCDPLPRAGVAVRETVGEQLMRAVDACLPGLPAEETPALRQRVSDALLSVFMAVEGRDRVDAVRLQAGVDAGWEQLWLADLEPAIATSGHYEACQLGDCRVLEVQPPSDRDLDAPRLALPEPFDGFTPSRGLVLRSIELARRSTCMETPGTKTRLEVEVDLDELAGLLGIAPDELPPAVADWLADRGLCLQEHEAGCTRWQVPLDLAFTTVEQG